MNPLARWRGVIALVGDAVEHGSRAIQRVQLETARRPFALLEHIPVIAAPARAAHAGHDFGVTFVHGAIRAVNAVAGKTAEVILQEVERRGADLRVRVEVLEVVPISVLAASSRSTPRH